MAQHLGANLGEQAYAEAPTRARLSDCTTYQRCTTFAPRTTLKARELREARAIGDDGSHCGRCTALWFSRVLTFQMRGASQQAKRRWRSVPLDLGVRLHAS